MTWSEEIKLAHSLGGTFDNGYWKFPSPEVAAQFQRIKVGLEWSPKATAAAHAALLKEGEAFRAKQLVPMEVSE
jgi:hypothetical protein